jgi:hypothetical protein
LIIEPIDEDELAALLHAAAPDVSSAGVAAAVVERVRRRRRTRRVRRATALVGVAAATVIVVAAVASVDGPTRVRMADPATSRPSARPSGERSPGRELARTAVPGQGDAVVPLTGGPGAFWLVRGSSSAEQGSGPRTISRWSARGELEATTVVEGIPAVGLDAFDRLWVVVVEPAAQGAPGWRLKEIRPGDGRVLRSIPLPLTAKPLVVAAGIADPTGNFVAVHSADEEIDVRIPTGAVSTLPATVPPPSPPTTVPRAPGADLGAATSAVPRGAMPAFVGVGAVWSIEGTDLVEREVP